MNSKAVHISIDELRRLSALALVRAGFPEEGAAISVDHYLENELSGKSSHGIVRVIEAAKVARKYGPPTDRPVIETDSGSMVTMNARRCAAPVAAMRAVDMALERAPLHGIALVGIRNYIASSGSMAYYLRRMTAHGLIAIMGCNSVAMVAPPGGTERMIGTNPLGIGIPGTFGNDLIADFGTGAITYGKIMVLKDKGEPVPEGMLVDAQGRPSTNPADAQDGAVFPLAGYKGFALGLMIELLAGPLIGASAIKKNSYDNDGLFIIAIDPSKSGHERFTDLAGEALGTISRSRPADSASPVQIPGERSANMLYARIASGYLDVPQKTFEDLVFLAGETL